MFDPEVATQAYLATMNAAARAKSDAYFEGGYWLQLIDFLFGITVYWALLKTRWGIKARDWLQGKFKNKFWQSVFFVGAFILLTYIIGLPLTIYEGFIREHAYGLANQTFIPWFGEQMIDLGISLLIGSLAVAGIYKFVQRFEHTWWLWSAGASAILIVIFATAAPVFIMPLFNKYTPLKASPLKSEILSMARANDIPADNVYLVDASKQSKRVSANVSGLFGTTRVSLNDNLLNRTTPAEVRSVMGHEMGHYALSHSLPLITGSVIFILAGFAFVHLSFGWVVQCFGAGWGFSSIADLAGLPLAAALISIFFFIITPLNNSLTRLYETQADLFGLNAAREPDGEALIDLKLAEYRKMDPSYWEEVIFFDHPSGANRIRMAMRWKAEHLNDPQVAVPNLPIGVPEAAQK